MFGFFAMLAVINNICSPNLESVLVLTCKAWFFFHKSKPTIHGREQKFNLHISCQVDYPLTITTSTDGLKVSKGIRWQWQIYRVEETKELYEMWEKLELWLSFIPPVSIMQVIWQSDSHVLYLCLAQSCAELKGEIPRKPGCCQYWWDEWKPQKSPEWQQGLS